MTNKRARRYAPLWENIKRDKVVPTQIRPLSLTDEQAKKAAKGLQRAVSKEKYEDIHFRNDYPAATLDFNYNPANRMLVFTLQLNTPESRSAMALKIL